MDNQKKYLYINFVLAVVSGAFYGIFQKLLYETKGEKGNFDHPYFVAFLLSISQVLVYVIYWFKT